MFRMAKMKWTKPSAETIAYFERIAPGPPIEARRMFGMPARFLNGHMLVGVFGDMLGVPVLPSYYGLRLLPWIVPEIEAWKREVLRERELGTDHEHHLHGL